jgi:hypothetical protein
VLALVASNGFKICQRVSALRPASICWWSGLPGAKRRKRKPGVNLFTAPSIWKRFLIHSSRIIPFHMHCNGSAIPCTLIHQAPSLERSSTDYGPLPPQPCMHKSRLLAQVPSARTSPVCSIGIDPSSPGSLHVAERRILHTASCIAQPSNRPIV